MRWLLLLPVTFLASCGAMTSLRAVSATADGVTFEYGEGLETEAAREASLYCANLGRRAELRQVTHQGGFGVSAFDCR